MINNNNHVIHRKFLMNQISCRVCTVRGSNNDIIMCINSSATQKGVVAKEFAM